MLHLPGSKELKRHLSQTSVRDAVGNLNSPGARATEERRRRTGSIGSIGGKNVDEGGGGNQ